MTRRDGLPQQSVLITLSVRPQIPTPPTVSHTFSVPYLAPPSFRNVHNNTDSGFIKTRNKYASDILLRVCRTSNTAARWEIPASLCRARRPPGSVMVSDVGASGART